MAERGFDGTTWTLDEFVKVLDKTKLPSWVQGVAIHCTGAPNLKQFYATTKSDDPDVDAAQRMKNFLARVNQIGGKGWHATAFPHRQIGKGTPMTEMGSAHNSWNDEMLACEMVMNGDDPKEVNSPDGQAVLDTAAFWASRILKKLGKPANKTTVRFHRDEPSAKRRGKTCPGRAVDHDDFLRRVQRYMDGDKPVDLPPEGLPPVAAFQPKPDWTTKEIQEHLVRLGFDPGPVDDQWGPKTKAAYKELQRLLGVLDTGIPGAWVVNKMRTLRQPPAKSEAPEPQAERGEELDYEPGKAKWSEYWLLPMMKKVEGLRLKAYSDKPGWAIGYGHNSTSGVKPIPFDGMTLKSEGEADTILRADLNEQLRYINTWVKVPLKQGQVDALCMHIFQQGPTQFRKRVLPTLNTGDHAKVAELIENMGHANAGVERRRRFEARRYRGELPTSW